MKQCMGCMEVYQDNLNKCPHCGYEEGTTPENTLHMEPGSILNNRYIIGKVLGYGGFGVTYIAWDSLLEQKVAIKEFLPSEFATRMLGRMEITIFSGDKHKQFMEGLIKFVEEAKKIAKFNNVPGIVKIFDCIEENNTAYIIMELLEGETLAVKLEREKKMKPDKAINLLLPVMEALKRVNANGIIHRDIAPDNIFITSKGEPKLIDFGAARYATTSLSRSLTIIIKPGYSPEEQYRSMGDQGSWTDVYSISATLYKMITGQTPTDSMERRAYMEQHGTDLMKPISKFNSQITKNQEIAIMNGLNVKVQDRTMNMGQLIEELTAVVEVQRIQSRQKKRNILLDIPDKVKIIGLVAALVFVLGAVVVDFVTSRETIVEKGMTRVPNIRNLSLETAVKQLDSCSLKYKIVGSTYSTEYKANRIMTQSRRAGETVKENSVIEVTVGKIDNAYEMDNIVGMSYEKAKSTLETAGFTVEVIEKKFNKVIEENCVISQSINKKEDENKVNLVVSKGRENSYTNETTTAPNFVGSKLFQAIKIAKDSCMMIEVVERKASKDYMEGEVIEQNIAEGETVDYGTVAQLVVSTGTNELEIGDLTNFNIQDARDYLSNYGMEIVEEYEVNPEFDHGIVFGQNPPPKTKLKTGEQVTLKVSIGRTSEFEMITLRGKTEEEAMQLLLEYGLKGKVEYGFSDAVDDGCVYSQSVARGEQVTVGDEITIKVSSQDAEMPVPDLVGKTISDAEKELNDIGLVIKKEKEFDENIPKNEVMSSDPVAGTNVKVGTTITVYYSGGKGDIRGVEDTVGIDYQQAEAILVGQGLEVEFDFVFSDTVDQATVISQDIAAGAQATSGDVITLKVSKGKEKRVVFLNESFEIEVGQTTELLANVEPAGVNVTWESENEDIAYTSTSATPKEDYDAYTALRVKVTGVTEGETNIVLKIIYVDGSETTHKYRVRISD